MAATTAAPARELPAQAWELPRRFGLIFTGLMSAMLLASLDQTIVSTALAPVVGELHGVNHMGWVTTASIVAAAAASTVAPIVARPVPARACRPAGFSGGSWRLLTVPSPRWRTIPSHSPAWEERSDDPAGGPARRSPAR